MNRDIYARDSYDYDRHLSWKNKDKLVSGNINKKEEEGKTKEGRE